MNVNFVLNRLKAYNFALAGEKTEYNIIEEVKGDNLTLYIFEPDIPYVRSAALGYESGSVMVLSDWTGKYPQSLEEVYYFDWVDIDDKIWEINKNKN